MQEETTTLWAVLGMFEKMGRCAHGDINVAQQEPGRLGVGPLEACAQGLLFTLLAIVLDLIQGHLAGVIHSSHLTSLFIPLPMQSH